MKWMVPRRSVNEMEKLRTALSQLRESMTATCQGSRVCGDKCRAECQKNLDKQASLSEHVSWLRAGISEVISRVEECPGSGWVPCQQAYEDLRYARRKLVKAYDITIAYLRSIHCATSNCVNSRNATVIVLTGQASHNQRALFNVPLRSVPLEHGLPGTLSA